ncbi:ThiF family adenylyltransferase [Lysinibacillus sp. NPDC094177]|uniref:ThiF family adenylyltransferase n=1 Tax=Lysinibacillus sp. NPDC094177 TaxID=3390580 RepID=UPI003CFF7665
MKCYWLKRGMFWTLKDDTVYFYFNDSKNKTGIHCDDSTKLFNLLELLKQPIDLDNIIKNNPYNSIDLLTTALNFLLDQGFIYYENEEEYESVYEKRLANYIGKFPKCNYYNFKKDVKDISTCLIGVGTAGSYIPELYFKMGFNNLILIDNDFVEEHNILSQNFLREDINNPKVTVLKNRYKSESNNIEAIKTRVESFEHLYEIVNLETINYILLFADDYDLTLDIIKKSFSINPHINIILSGYSSFEVENLLINTENKEVFIKALEEDLLNFKSLDDVIIENSGSILDSFYIAFGTLKIMIDHAINLNKTEYAIFNHLNNDSFIGSIFEYNLRENSTDNRIKSLLYQDSFSKQENANWISPLSLDNINKNNKISTPVIDKVMHNYIYLEKFNMSSYNKILSFKNKIPTPNNLKNQNISKNKNELLNIFQRYLFENFNENITNKLSKIMKNGYLYTNQNLYGDNDYVTLKLKDSIAIYCPLTEDINSLNYLIHELLHAIYYLNDNDDLYDHEKFVYKHHIKFLNEFDNIPLINQLKEIFIFSTLHTYLTYSISCEYEKYTYLNKLDDFYKVWAVENSELYYILSSNISTYNILNSYKYVYAINQNLQEFLNLLSKNQKINKELIH